MAEQVEKRSETTGAQTHLIACSVVIKKWLAVYAAQYREETTEPLALGYREGLKDCRDARTLHEAFGSAMKLANGYRPTVDMVLRRYNALIVERPTRPQLEAPPLSEVDRQEVQKAFDKLREQLKIPTRTATKKRQADLKKQAREIMNNPKYAQAR